MYSKLHLAIKYFDYYLSASNGKGHGMHSPFVFDFITRILNDKKDYTDYKRVESLREKLLKNEKILTIEDFGAGSSTAHSNQRTVASIAKHTVKPKKFAQLLYRMVKYYQPKTILELGTSLGLTTSYLSLASPEAKLITMEGSPEVSTVAKENFKELGIGNVQLTEGNFDYTLPAVLYKLPTVDLAFIDGNHRQEPTENYFHQLLSKSNNDSIMVFDDIHWSHEMEAAWKTIAHHPAVRCSIDLFFIGIILFRQEFKEKQHFSVRW